MLRPIYPGLYLFVAGAPSSLFEGGTSRSVESESSPRGARRTMKVIYNWLKEFVDVTAPPNDVASRLALSGTNIGSVENGPHGAVIDAEVGSNRPDCLAHYGIARELGARRQAPAKAGSAKARGGHSKSSRTP